MANCQQVKLYQLFLARSQCKGSGNDVWMMVIVRPTYSSLLKKISSSYATLNVLKTLRHELFKQTSSLERATTICYLFYSSSSSTEHHDYGYISHNSSLHNN